MNNIMKFFAATCLLVNVLCFAMDAPSKQMVKFQVSKNDSNGKVELDRDIVFGDVAPRANKPTQLSLRATCHYGEKNIKIDELEEGRSYLVNPFAFRSVWSGSTERPNHSLSDFKQLKKIFELTEIEGKSPSQAKALRSSLVNAVVPWNGARDDSNHGKRTGIYLIAPLYQEDHKKFAAQLQEQHFYNKPRERDEYCVVS